MYKKIKEDEYIYSQYDLRQFANVIFNMLELGFVGRAAFIDNCLTEFRSNKEQNEQVDNEIQSY